MKVLRKKDSLENGCLKIFLLVLHVLLHLFCAFDSATINAARSLIVTPQSPCQNPK